MNKLRSELQQSHNAALEEEKRAVSAAAKASYMSADSLGAEVRFVTFHQKLHLVMHKTDFGVVLLVFSINILTV